MKDECIAYCQLSLRLWLYFKLKTVCNWPQQHAQRHYKNIKFLNAILHAQTYETCQWFYNNC